MLRLRPFPIAACLLPLVLTACGDSSNLDDPRTQAPLVRPGTVEGASEASRSFTGVVAARVQSDLGFRVSGKILERLVETGQSEVLDSNTSLRFCSLLPVPEVG